MATAITAPYFHDNDKAREYLEAVRWPDGPVCPHCKTEGGWTIESKPDTKNKARPGLYKCVSAECGKQFSVTVGTVFERSKIPLSKWLFAAYLLCSSKKGMSAHQLHRTLGVTYKTTWFLAHRIRHAMDSTGGLLGQNGGIIEQRNGEVRSTVVTNFAQVKNAFEKRASFDAHDERSTQEIPQNRPGNL